MDSLAQQKLQLLQLYYPSYLLHFLQELLTLCLGDVASTRALIDGLRPKKRGSSYQAPLAGVKSKVARVAALPNLPGSPKSSAPPARSKIITLNTPGEVAAALGRYASLHLNFLPERLTKELQADILGRRDLFKCNQFYLFGNQCQLNHLTGVFSRPHAEYPRMVYNGQRFKNVAPYTPLMERSAALLESFMNEKVIPKVERLPFQLKEPWSNDFNVINCYDKLHNNLDWHSDRLSHIGPHNFVASISLGSTRMFRLRNTYVKHAPIYQIPLPHNSLLLMQPGCQEEFKHCVSPMLKAIDVHPELGTLRLGITSRFYPCDFIENLPKCKCDMRMILRRSYKTLSTRGRYFWLCENTYQNKACATFHWADFSNAKGHYIAEKPECISVWVAPEDQEKLEYDRESAGSETSGRTEDLKALNNE